VAEKRLRAVKELVELGSGFKIAMKDLEIRGAGNLLGASQSGHMAAIGYDLYCKMLEEAVKGLKGMPVAPTIETAVELTAAAYVPEGYILDDRQKMEIYKKIAAIHSRKDLYRVQEELEDRFGTIPEPVETLMRIAHIKALAQRIGIQSLTEDQQRVQLLFHPTAKVNPLMVVEGMARYEKSLSFNGGTPPFFAIRKPRNHTRDALLRHIESVLEHLGSFHAPEN
jgi:transcription-repair coupling factor (superfamily II helicase)